MSMKRMLVMPIIAAWIGLFTACSGTSVTPDPFVSEVVRAYPELSGKQPDTARVTRVIDGDTFETAAGDKVRLIGVDTPESVKPGSPVEYFGKEASQFSVRQLADKNVYLFADTENKDRYGRLLRYVFIEEQSTMYNEILIREGYANPLTVPPNVMFADKFVEAERHARTSQKGLWRDTPPQDEGAMNTPACREPKIKGNINSRKEKIYHVPGGTHYSQTIAEEMFCSEDEAQAAGYRKPKN